MDTVYKNDFLDRMAIGKQNAMNRRNRGNGASSHGSWTAKRSAYAPVDQDSHAFVISTMGERWQACRIDALEDFLRAIYPERYEAFE